MRKLRLLGFLLVIAFLLALIPSAIAHEHRIIKIGPNEVEFKVGWTVEPTYADTPNSVDFTATVASSDFSKTGSPVYGLDKALKVEVSTGGKQTTLSLVPIIDDETGEFDGEYYATIMPTVPGTYVLRFFGTVNGTVINERFECGDKTFDCVKSLSDIQFPEQNPSGRELQLFMNDVRSQLAQLNDLRSQVSQLQQIVNDLKNQLNTRPTGDSQSAYMFGIAGIITGIVGVVFGAIALVRTRKPRK